MGLYYNKDVIIGCKALSVYEAVQAVFQTFPTWSIAISMAEGDEKLAQFYIERAEAAVREHESMNSKIGKRYGNGEQLSRGSNSGTH